MNIFLGLMIPFIGTAAGATACFSLGVKKSQKLLKKYNAKAVFVDKNNNVYVSDGVEFTLTAKNYKIV